MAVTASNVGIGQFVAGQLLGDKLVVRLVLVERLDHVIAIAPGVLQIVVVFVTRAIGVASHVQPHAGPALAVVWRIEKFVHQLFVGVRVGVLHKRVDFGGRGQQPDQVQIHAANQNVSIRDRRSFQTFLVALRLTKGVDWDSCSSARRALAASPREPAS